MKDVNLNELIQEERDNKKSNFKSKSKVQGGHLKNKKIVRGARRVEVTKGDRQGKFNKNEKRLHKNRDDRPNNKPKFNKNRDDKFKKPEPKEYKPKDEQVKQEKGRTLKVLGLHPDIKNEDLYKLFAAEGALQKCMIEQDNFGRNLPSAIVKYHSGDAAKTATSNLNNKKVLNSVLTVQPYKNIRN